jgi:hypothetical protein
VASDANCQNIPNTVGIIGTPIIDPSSDTVYFFSKGYEGGASGGGLLKGLCQNNSSTCVWFYPLGHGSDQLDRG